MPLSSVQLIPSNLSPPLRAEPAANTAWSVSKTLSPKTSARRMWRSNFDDLSSETRIISGLRDREPNALTVLPCLKRKDRTKEIVKDKLRKAVNELKVGIDTSDSYTVENAVCDWLAKGTKSLSAKTINDYKSLAESNLIPFIGAYKLRS